MSDSSLPSSHDASPQQFGKVRAYLCRLATHVTRPAQYGFQFLRRDRDDGSIEYQIFADTKGNGRQIAWVQSSRHDAEFITACLAQAPLFEQLLAPPLRSDGHDASPQPSMDCPWCHSAANVSRRGNAWECSACVRSWPLRSDGGAPDEEKDDLSRVEPLKVGVDGQDLSQSDNEPSPSPAPERKCQCGLGDEPWHWPRGGVCTVGMEKAPK